MTTFFFCFCLSRFVFPEFQQFPSKWKKKKKKAVYGFHNFIQVSSEPWPGTFQPKGSFLTKPPGCSVTLIPCDFVFQLRAFLTALLRARALGWCQLIRTPQCQGFARLPVSHTHLDSLHQAVSGRCSRWKSLTLSPETTPRQHVAQRNTTQHVEIAVSGIRVFILQFPGQPGPWHRGKSWTELTRGKHSSFPGFWRWSQERTKWACLFIFFPSLAVLHEFSLYRYSERVCQWIFCTQKFQILSLLFFLHAQLES